MLLGMSMVGGGFGPSSGRLVEVCEPSDARILRETKALPPVVWAIAFAVSFLGVVIGMTYLYEDELFIGWTILIATAAVVVLLLIWQRRL